MQSITLNGYAEATYSYNFNKPASGMNQVRVFDFEDRKAKLDNAELVLQRAVSNTNDIGFRVDAVAGQTVPRLSASAGLFRDASGKAGNFDLQQILVSYIAPVGKGLRIDAGKFVTHFAYEVISGYDGYNDQATRGFLFGYGVPYTHTGIKASYAFSPKWTGMLEVTEGWDVWKDNNSSKSLGGQVAFTPTDDLAVYVNAMVGPERTGNDSDKRAVTDIVATWKASPKTSFAADILFGNEKNAGLGGTGGTWSSAVWYGHHAFSPRFALNFRDEMFDDPGGSRTGAAQRFHAYTLTPEVTLTPHFLVRSDLRLDRSSPNAFEKGSALTGAQPTVLVSVIAKF